MQSSTEGSLRPGEIVMRTLFADFTQQAEKKIEAVMLETSVRLFFHNSYNIQYA